MTYQLFAARHGDVVHRYLQAGDRDTAERLAASVIAEAFALERDCFDEIVSETDGYYLELVERAPIDHQPMLSALRKIGNSTGIVLPRSILGAIGLESGAALELTVENGRLIGTPVKRAVRAVWAEAAAGLAVDAPVDAQASDWTGFGNRGDDDLQW